MYLTRRGAKGTRTPNPLLAKQVRYLLRHGPSVTIALVGDTLAARGENPHQASIPQIYCAECAIRLEAPSTAFCVMVPTQWRGDIASERDRGVAPPALRRPRWYRCLQQARGDPHELEARDAIADHDNSDHEQKHDHDRHDSRVQVNVHPLHRSPPDRRAGLRPLLCGAGAAAASTKHDAWAEGFVGSPPQMGGCPFSSLCET